MILDCLWYLEETFTGNYIKIFRFILLDCKFGLFQTLLHCYCLSCDMFKLGFEIENFK